jgi:hypothetical protein
MSIKIERARKIAAIGSHPQSFARMLDSIPASVIEKLTARQLAGLIDANWRLAGASKRLAEEEAVANGVVWDYRRGHAREIAPTA